ncbi:glycosyltransferase family 2 protein [Fodinisporobacter ferrooxydans]|uniref:Glycosyltransferase family 2 protein n=1 Tax=Fodinisporobacter ferrooxydans TaxID=2901836 RepID=A0ABY4CJN2_9BACL|nr:glycosyltransferase family 2 protein [Alicyclobacillaceae bacterium MYW30-H2]
MSYSREPGLVSIIIPSNNNSAHIEDCLDSLIKQNYKNIEIIVVDDASVDKTNSIVLKWRSRTESMLGTNRIIHCSIPRTIKETGIITIGFFLARGEFIALHHPDDISHPERMQKQVEYLQGNPDVQLLGTNYTFFEDGCFEKQTMATSLQYGSEDIFESFSFGNHCICAGSVMLRGNLFDRLGGLNRSMLETPVYEFIFRCVVLENINAVNIQDILYYRRSKGGNTHENKWADVW